MHRGSLTQPLMRGLQSQQRVAAAAAAPSFWTQTTSSTMKNYMSTDENSDSSSKSNLPFFLDPGTKGGAVFISLAAFIIPIIGYNIAVTAFDMDGIEVGKWIGAGFTIVATLGWVASYIFRVANKDMTYVSVKKSVYLVSLARDLTRSSCLTRLVLIVLLMQTGLACN
jgi:hypothetical protein